MRRVHQVLVCFVFFKWHDFLKTVKRFVRFKKTVNSLVFFCLVRFKCGCLFGECVFCNVMCCVSGDVLVLHLRNLEQECVYGSLY